MTHIGECSRCGLVKLPHPGCSLVEPTEASERPETTTKKREKNVGFNADKYKQMREDHRVAGDWFKLQDEQSVRVRFTSEPEAVEVDGFDGQPTTRFRIELYNLTDEVAQTWDMSGKVLDDWIAMGKRYGMDGIVYEIERDGTGTKTRYRFHYIPPETSEGPVPPAAPDDGADAPF